MTFALQEARRRCVPMTVVHACEAPDVALPVFDLVRQQVAAEASALDVDYLTERGTPVDVLLKLALSSSVVVLGADEVPWTARVSGAEISQHVAMTADSPVVVVPRTTFAGRQKSRVVIALDDSGPVDGQLAYGFAAAARQGEAIEVVYAAGMTSDYPGRQAHWHRLEDALDIWRARQPATRVHTSVEAGHPVNACVIASARASLLVVGQPTGAHPRIMSRAVASRLLRRSSAPVAVVPVDLGRHDGQEA